NRCGRLARSRGQWAAGCAAGSGGGGRWGVSPPPPRRRTTRRPGRGPRGGRAPPGGGARGPGRAQSGGAEHRAGSSGWSVSEARADTEAILATARGLLRVAGQLIEARGLTLVGVALSNLGEDSPVQLALPFEQGSRDALDGTLDTVRERWGTGAITRARLLGH